MKIGLSLLVAATALASAAAEAQTTYRWVDPASGRTIFSDQPPPAGARNTRELAGSTAGDEAPLPYSVRAAAGKFPVTLYTSTDCSDACSNARNLLNGRGVPFTEKSVGDADTVAALKQLTGGEAFVPVVVIGREHIKGFQAANWNNMLDLAGYPKTAPYGSRPMPLPKPAAPAPTPQPDTAQEAPAADSPAQ